MKNIILSIIFLLILSGNSKAQPRKIKIDADGISLNRVLIEMRDNYGIQFSFDDKLLSRYRITANMEFDSKEDAISFLLKGLPLSVEKSGDIFVVFPSPSERHPPGKNKITRVDGQVVEAGTLEPLPFSYITINNRQVQSDQNGNFTFLASTDTIFTMQISHLGYYVYDTLFHNSLNRKFFLTPSVTELKEVKVEGFTVERSTIIGDAAGKMKVNHSIAPYLPGYGDNSVYNLLRLMPGVMASGEQASELMVWGSYESHSKVEFDGFTLFGLKNFNDNIGVVNPLLIQNIRISKGGYEANYGDRVGGIIQISGKKGNLYKPALTLNINNSTINLLVEMPLGKKSSVLAAYRQTYYELYDPYDLNMFGNRQMSNSHDWFNNMVDVLAVPDYKFSDANFKYSYRGDEGDIFTAGLYRGKDRYSSEVEGEYSDHMLENSQNERNTQWGTSIHYGKPWGKGHNREITLSYSGLTNYISESNSVTSAMQHGMQQHNQENKQVNNEIKEFSTKLENKFSLLNGTQVDVGLGFQVNDVLFPQNAIEENGLNLGGISEKLHLFVQGIFPIAQKLRIKPGLRSIYANEPGALYFEPKLSASLNITGPIKINASWGQYHQFLSKIPFVDENLNYSWYWINSDAKTIPVLDAVHWVSGISYTKNDFLFSVEGYSKKTSGITRYYSGTQETDQGFYSGKSRSYGIDFYLKKEYKKNVAWISYTLSKVEENLSFDVPGTYRPAPHNQRHELKLAAIYILKSLYFSTNYVYGSGIEIMKNFRDDNTPIPIYSRLDAAVIYKFSRGKIFGNLGFSVLNVLNRQNIKYTNLKRIETDTAELVNVHSEAVPFTPTLFLKLGL